MLTEKQNLRYDLLKANSYEVAAAKACYEFITGPDDQAPAKQQTSGAGVVDIIPDGIYLVMADDKNTAVLYRPGMQLMVEEVTRCIGIGVKQGDRSLTVALRDAADGDTELTTEKGGSRFITKYHDAVADWDSKAATEDLREILHPNIKLGENQTIPTLGQLYFILAHFREINEALAAVGGDTLQDLWYWSSTQYSATNAWGLDLGNGYANFYTKATGQGRVRPVSAFLPLTVNL